MPAIQPARLKHQAVLLAGYFDRPASYVRSLHHLLEFYADRAHRPGRTGEPPPLVEAYNVRPPVLRGILRELVPLARQDPPAALVLCDALWDRPYLEFKLLAVLLLGQTPAEHPQTVFERVNRWLKDKPGDRLVSALLDQGLGDLRRRRPDRLIDQIEEWLSSSDVFPQQNGLKALIPLIVEPTYVNLPLIFQLIQPFCRVALAALRPDLLKVLEALAHRSPGEAAYFLRQNLETPGSPDTAWLIRQALPAFPLENQQSLKAALRSAAYPTRNE